MGDSSSLFNTLASEVKDDPNLSVISSGQMFTGASIPFGVPSGLPKLDLAFGRPGWPAGRIIELYGFESSGKTTLGLTAIRNVQKMGGVGFFIDSEKTFDAYRAQSLDVELNYDDNFHRVEVRSMDAGFRAIKSICASVKKSGFGRPIVVVYDSVMGAANEYDIEQEIGAEQRTGHEAKVIKQGIRAISTDVSETKVLVFLINHAIENARASWGKKSKAAGGHAIKLWSSSRVELTGIGKITTSDRTSRTGQKVKIQLEKSKVGSLAITNFDVELLDATGFNTAASMLEAMEDVGMVSHTKGSKKFTLNPIEGVAEEAIEFEKKEWPKVLSSLGGEDKMYNLFYSYCFDKGLMRRYE